MIEGDSSLLRLLADPLRNDKSFFCCAKMIGRFLIPPAEAGSIRNDNFILLEWEGRAGGMPEAFHLLFPPFNSNISCHSEQSEESPSHYINLNPVIPNALGAEVLAKVAVKNLIHLPDTK
jgi:hypothetical protein